MTQVLRADHARDRSVRATRQRNVVMSVRRSGVVLIALLCSACGPSVPLDSLPQIPDVVTGDVLPAIAEQLDAARAEFDREPGKAANNGRLGLFYLTYKMDAAAEVALRRARRLSPRRFLWAYYHGEALYRLGDYAGSAQALANAVELKPESVDARVRLGVVQLRSGDQAAARDTIDAILSDEPERTDARYELGRLQARMGETDAAIATFERVLKENGPFADGYFALAEIHRLQGNTELAQRYRDQFERYKGLQLAGRNRLLGQLGQFDRSATSLLRRADQLSRTGRIDAAIKALEQAVQLDPGSMTAHSSLLLAYANRRDFAAVDRQFEQGLKANPNDAVLYRNLGRARAIQQRIAESEQALRRSLELIPADAKTMALLGVLLEDGRQGEEAERMYTAALEYDPREMMAHSRLAVRLLAREDYEGAVEHLNALARFSRGKNASQQWRRLGEAYLRIGQPESARAAFESGVEQAKIDNNEGEAARIQRALAALGNGANE